MHHHKDQIISDWFLERDNEFTLLKWPPQSPDLNPIEHLCDVVEREIHIMDVQTTNLQELSDDMSLWTKTSEECFQHLVESMTWRIKAVLKEKGGPTQYQQVYLIKSPVSVYIYIYTPNLKKKHFKHWEVQVKCLEYFFSCMSAY